MLSKVCVSVCESACQWKCVCKCLWKCVCMSVKHEQQKVGKLFKLMESMQSASGESGGFFCCSCSFGEPKYNFVFLFLSTE